MKAIPILILLISFQLPSISQTSSDSSLHFLKVKKIYDDNFYPYSKQKVKLVVAGNVIGYGATMVGLYSAWYKNYPQSSFHFFNDNKEWLQVDKTGHAYSAYTESYASSEMWRWTGINRQQRILLGVMTGIGYQTLIETLDGFSSQWGWSWGDFSANIVGGGLWAGQEIAWNDQRIQLKFSFHKKDYGNQELNNRAKELYGQHIYQRFLKDYNGQTYWISANIKSFIPESNVPSWLNFAVGYGAEGMFGALENIERNAQGSITFDRRDIVRYRQWYITPDIDFKRIKTKNKILKIAFGVLNTLKFPTPSLEYSKGAFQFHFFHF